MNGDKDQIVADRHGTVRDPRGMIPDLSEEDQELLDQIIKLLKKLGLPDTVLQTGFLTDKEEEEEQDEDAKKKRYVFTGSFMLKKDDKVLYTPLPSNRIFEVVVTGKP